MTNPLSLSTFAALRSIYVPAIITIVNARRAETRQKILKIKMQKAK
jgi:hypothetical protein